MKLRYKLGIAAVLLALACFSSSSAEIANLRNGFSIRHERHEQKDNVTRLYLSGAPGSYVDVPTAEIADFEKDDTPAPPVLRPVPAPSLDDVVRAASSRNNIDPDLINSVIRAESGFNAKAISPKGARGLMQLMPQTAARLGVQNAFDPADNVEGGTRYLKELLGHYNNDVVKALAAYNAGPERVEQYKGVPPYPETIAYVSRIVKDFNQRRLVGTNSRGDESTATLVRHPLSMSSTPQAATHTEPLSPAAGREKDRVPPVGSAE